MTRKPRTGLFKPKNPGKYKGNAGNIIFRSTWELKVMQFLDLSENVVSWQSEEKIIAYKSPVDQKIHRYFPDFIAVIKNKKTKKLETIMIEVKPKSQTVPPKPGNNKKKYIKEVMTYGVNQAKWKAAEYYCEQRGWQFKVLTEDHIFGKGVL